MNIDESPTPELRVFKSTEDQLAALCQQQQRRIASLVEHNATLQRANETLGGELLEESRRRSEALATLQHVVAQGKEMCHRLVHERDTVLAALRSLCDHLKNQPITSLTYFGGAAFERSYREAAELLTLIDQLQRHQAALDSQPR